MDGDDILRSLSDASDETEFYTPMPPGYRPGQKPGDVHPVQFHELDER